jgi:photosystem II stability/assembly factor-like uncharacterized protein
MKKLVFIPIFALCALHSALSQQYGWIDLSANIPASVNNIRDAFFIGEEGWISGGYSSQVTIYHTSDGGQSFTSQNVPAGSGNEALSIFMRSPLEGYMVTNTGHILKTADGGNNWSTIGTGMGLLYSVSFPPLPEPTGYACSGNGSVYKITGSVIMQDHHLTGASYYSVCFPLNSDEGWVCGGTVIQHKTAAGWQDDQNYNGSKAYNAVYFVDNQHGWAAGAPSGQGTIIYTLNGIDWIAVTNTYNQNFNDVFFVNTQEGWIAGNSILLHSTDGGLTWVKEAENLTDSAFLSSVFAVNNHEVYVTGGKGSAKALFLKHTQVTGIRDNTAPSQIFVFQNQPNPFSKTTVIRWQIPLGIQPSAVSKWVVIKVFDFMGKEIKILVDEDMAPGEHQVIFDASGLPAGVYFYQFQTNGRVETRKMIVTK